MKKRKASKPTYLRFAVLLIVPILLSCYLVYRSRSKSSQTEIQSAPTVKWEVQKKLKLDTEKVEIRVFVYQFNFEMGTFITVVNTGDSELVYQPDKIKLIASGSRELQMKSVTKKVAEGKYDRLLAPSKAVVIAPHKSKEFSYGFDPGHAVENEAQKSLLLQISGIKRLGKTIPVILGLRK